jgi:hypothetical protein
MNNSARCKNLTSACNPTPADQSGHEKNVQTLQKLILSERQQAGDDEEECAQHAV